MIIDQLPNIQLPVLATDEMPVERGQYTYKAAFEDISATIKNGLDVIRPNLLDNWFFMSGDYYGLPINSRNKSTYSIPAARTYTLDRWFVYDGGGSGTFEKYSNGVKLTKSGSTIELGQFLEPSLIGETVTISVLVENTRRLISGTGVVANNAVLIDDPYLTASFTRESSAVSTMTVLHLTFKSNSSLVLAAKLEIGDSQTLAHEENGTWVLNELPNYEEQLTRCMVSRADQSDVYANNVISYNAPNPNLLDNWYFVGGGSQQGGGQFPINQRGQASYSTNWSYTIDRWKMGNGSYPLSVSAIGITSSGVALMQIVNYRDLLGKEVTASAVVNGTCAFATVQIPNQLPAGWTRLITVSVENSTISIDIDASSLMFIFDINSGDVFKAVKLELGTTQTLAHQENGVWVLNEIPNYQQELAKCQRYFIRLGMTEWARYGFGVADSATNVAIVVNLPVTMASSPMASYSGDIRVGGNAITSMSQYPQYNTNGVAIDIVTTGLSAGSFYMMRNYNDASAHVDISADL